MLDLLIGVFICMVATWRVSYMIANEDGPFAVFLRLRRTLPLGGLTTCMYCVSVWAAAVLWLLWQTPAQVVVVFLAVSGGALMLGAWTGANYRGKTNG